MSFYIQKYSGEKELFDIQKFNRSLKRAGASQELIDELVQELQALSSVRTTKEIYEFALSRLKTQHPGLAARYNIKQALLNLGPSGFPFERYIAALFRAQGYETKTGTIVQGACISHEIDVLAIKQNEHLLTECKFHQQGLTVDAKVPLYIKARFDDVTKQWTTHGDTHKQHKAVIVTNTRFSTQAIAYAQCVGIELLGWSYPEQGSLEQLIDRYTMHPITALVSLSSHQKKILLDNGFVLCQDVVKHPTLLDVLHLSEQDKEHLMQEMKAVCSIKPS